VQQQQQYYEHPEPPEPLLYPAHFSKVRACARHCSTVV
jgi:hypothetical protein